jgi:Dyp-type peroxidase family
MLNQFDSTSRPLLEGIQGNILKAHGRHYTANIFIRCNDGKEEKAKAWLKSLVGDKQSLIQSAYDQLRTNVLFKEINDRGGSIDTGTFACVHISAIGYTYLFGNDPRAKSFEAAYLNGMKKADLNDPAPKEWELGLQADNHFMLLLAHANKNELSKVVEGVQQDTDSFGSITTLEWGNALLNKEGAGIEHFGYVDGVSQPLFFEDEWESYAASNNIHNDQGIKFDPRANKDLVLLQDPFAPKDDKNALGSYFVFRKLEQDVKGFKLAESRLSDKLKLKEGDDERAGAMLVGRFEDGTPVQLDYREGLIHNSVINNFGYDSADASRCPYHAHIRKVNPRFGPVKEEVQAKNNHVMARRGIPFGSRTDDPNDGHIYNKPEKDVGLLFMSYQASINNQFEFIQNNWANSPNQPDPNNPEGTSNKPVGIDPIIGQGVEKRIGEFATTWGDPGTLKEADFKSFVTMKGGEYFFAPSISFLKNL